MSSAAVKTGAFMVKTDSIQKPDRMTSWRIKRNPVNRLSHMDAYTGQPKGKQLYLFFLPNFYSVALHAANSFLEE